MTARLPGEVPDDPTELAQWLEERSAPPVEGDGWAQPPMFDEEAE